MVIGTQPKTVWSSDSPSCPAFSGITRALLLRRRDSRCGKQASLYESPRSAGPRYRCREAGTGSGAEYAGGVSSCHLGSLWPTTNLLFQGQLYRVRITNSAARLDRPRSSRHVAAALARKSRRIYLGSDLWGSIAGREHQPRRRNCLR